MFFFSSIFLAWHDFDQKPDKYFVMTPPKQNFDCQGHPTCKATEHSDAASRRHSCLKPCCLMKYRLPIYDMQCTSVFCLS